MDHGEEPPPGILVRSTITPSEIDSNKAPTFLQKHILWSVCAYLPCELELLIVLDERTPGTAQQQSATEKKCISENVSLRKPVITCSTPAKKGSFSFLQPNLVHVYACLSAQTKGEKKSSCDSEYLSELT